MLRNTAIPVTSSRTGFRALANCLGDHHLNFCIIYLDDIIVYSKTPEEHLERLEAVFQKIGKAGLKLKPSKCEFCKSRITYLGHIDSKEGITTDPKKIKAIQLWPRPTTVTEVRKFTRWTNYYRKFIHGYAKVAHPLHDLVSGKNAKKKNSSIEWTTDCEVAFHKLKELCSSTPVLAYPDYKQKFKLYTDASENGLGTVLTQIKDDNLERMVTYASRTLSKSERNYDAHKLEFLALKWAITDQFHEYLYGGTFDVYTDNNPLTYILTSAKLDAVGQRWVASLGNYNFSLHYNPGRQNTVADSLSRIPCENVTFYNEIDYRKKTVVACHDKFGHLSMDKTFSLLQERFFWPRMNDDVCTHIHSCERCIRFKEKPEREEMSSFGTSYPHEIVHIDFLMIGSKKDPNKEINVLVITDHFTCYAQVFVTTSQTAIVVAQTLYKEYFLHNGWPDKLHSDQAGNFERKVIAELCKIAQVQKISTTPYNPKGNAQCEKFNQTLLNMIGTLDPADKAKWQQWVPTLTHSYNCTRCESTDLSPYYLLYGRLPHLPINIEYGVTQPELIDKSRQSYARKLHARLNWAYKVAKDVNEKNHNIKNDTTIVKCIVKNWS